MLLESTHKEDFEKEAILKAFFCNKALFNSASRVICTIFARNIFIVVDFPSRQESFHKHMPMFFTPEVAIQLNPYLV